MLACPPGAAKARSGRTTGQRTTRCSNRHVGGAQSAITTITHPRGRYGLRPGVPFLSLCALRVVHDPSYGRGEASRICPDIHHRLAHLGLEVALTRLEKALKAPAGPCSAQVPPIADPERRAYLTKAETGRLYRRTGGASSLTWWPLCRCSSRRRRGPGHVGSSCSRALVYWGPCLSGVWRPGLLEDLPGGVNDLLAVGFAWGVPLPGSTPPIGWPQPTSARRMAG